MPMCHVCDCPCTMYILTLELTEQWTKMLCTPVICMHKVECDKLYLSQAERNDVRFCFFWIVFKYLPVALCFILNSFYSLVLFTFIVPYRIRLVLNSWRLYWHCCCTLSIGKCIWVSASHCHIVSFWCYYCVARSCCHQMLAFLATSMHGWSIVLINCVTVTSVTSVLVIIISFRSTAATMLL